MGGDEHVHEGKALAGAVELSSEGSVDRCHRALPWSDLDRDKELLEKGTEPGRFRSLLYTKQNLALRNR